MHNTSEYIRMVIVQLLESIFCINNVIVEGKIMYWSIGTMYILYTNQDISIVFNSFIILG